MATTATDTSTVPNAASKEDSYILDSAGELDRLRINHQVFKASTNGKLVFAPLDLHLNPSNSHPNSTPTLKILDSATADGTWLRDFASSLPSNIRENSTFIGTDLTEFYIQKAQAEANTANLDNFQYFVQDINSPWPTHLHNTFTVVHQRLALAGAAAGGPRGIPDEISRLVELVAPGGYIQLVEGENTCDEDDGPAMHELVGLLRTVFGYVGLNPMFVGEGYLKRWLEEAGVEDVTEEVVPCLYGVKAVGSNKGEEGRKWVDEMAWSMGIAVVSLVAIIKSFPTLPEGLDLTALDTLHLRIDEEMKRQGGNYPLRVVWGRKPG